MQDFYLFAGDHPILTIILACMLLGTIVRLMPWHRRRDNTDDDDE